MELKTRKELLVGRKKRSKLLLFGLVLGLFSVISPVMVFGAEQNTHAANESGLYQMEEAGNYERFINYVDGYSLTVDQNMKVDMDYSAVCAVLENADKRIEIYKQMLPAGVSQTAYINYSNQFISDTADYSKEYEGTATAGGRTAQILQWSRNKLNRVENDKNYYASIEIFTGKREVYTILVKSSLPFYTTGGYQYLIDDFTTFLPTKSPFMRTALPVSPEDRGWNQETKDFYHDYFGTDSSLTWGIFEPHAPDDFMQLDYLEESMNYQFPILLNYTNFENNYQHSNLKYRLENAYKKNKTLELTLQTSWQEEGNMVFDVLNGEYDSFLQDYASVISQFGHPVLFRLGNEMNGDWCPYSGYHTAKDTMIYKEFYRYLHQVFEDAGADNVIWIWNPNGKSFPDFDWNQAVMYYPGDEYVDIIGLTAYNTGTYYQGETWTEFDDLYDSLYAEYDELFRQPMMITEFASSSVGGDKEQWIRDMFDHILAYENIKVAVWWDGCDWDSEGNVARPYFIDETPQIVEVFKELLNKQQLFWDVYA